MQVMTRVKCRQCNGKLGWNFEGSHGRESFISCRCTDKSNPAGKGFEVDWVELSTYTRSSWIDDCNLIG